MMKIKIIFRVFLFVAGLLLFNVIVNFVIDNERQKESIWIARHMIGQENVNVLLLAYPDNKYERSREYWIVSDRIRIDHEKIRYTSSKNGFYTYYVYDSNYIQRKWNGCFWAFLRI
jgi:hypothetical protein